VKLIEMSMERLLEDLGAPTPAPGGGSVAALAGALAAALCRMVAGLTAGKEQLADSRPDMERVLRDATALQNRLGDLADEDSRAFRDVIEARRLPRGTAGERKAREKAMQDAVLRSAQAPLSTLRALRELSALALCVCDKGNPGSVTDAGSSAQMIRAGAVCAVYNVRINLPSLRDAAARERLGGEARRLLQEVLDETQKTESIVEARLADLHAGG